jgi:hypothetical protein
MLCRAAQKEIPFHKATRTLQGNEGANLFDLYKPWCGNEWDTSTPDNILNKSKHGCPVCNLEQQNIRWKEDFLEWLIAERQDIELMSPLTQYDDPHDWICTLKECMHTWSVDFNSIRGANSGCSKCGINKVQRVDQYQKKNLRNG